MVGLALDGFRYGISGRGRSAGAFRRPDDRGHWDGAVRSRLQDVSFGGGEVRALDDVSLDIPSGAIFGIIGRSGAGKSTLLRTVNRLEEPSSGRVLVDGEPIATLGTDGLVGMRRRIGMIFQHFNLLSAKTVRQNVALPLTVAGVEKREIARRVEEALRLVGWRARRRRIRRACRRPEATGRHRPCPGERSGDPALRRGDLGAGPGGHPVDPGLLRDINGGSGSPSSSSPTR